jgi:predicted transcriptional regulator
MLITQAENETASLTDQQAETVQHALEAAGIIFVEENGKGPGVRLRKQR